MQRQAEPLIAPPCQFFDQYLLVAEIFNARAAVLLVRPHEQQSLLAGFQECVPIDDTLLAPAILMRLDFVDHETANGVAEHLMLVIEYVSVHS